MSITGLKRSTIYFKMKEGNFPNNIPIGERSVAWVEGEVINWIDGNISKREMRC
ncbi:TPA: AlpA family phage regulatory protein [Yersinia enterocolitica]|nr:AlpA family phage regulatory protein [Yersinia enterocolitica]